MQITRENISSKKAQDLRFEKGLCSEELYYALKEKGGLNYLGDSPTITLTLTSCPRRVNLFVSLSHWGSKY